MRTDIINEIKSSLKKIKSSNDIKYIDIKPILDDLINEENKRILSGKYTIDLEGDFIFSGTFDEVVNFITNKRLNKKRNKKEYGLTTPTDEDIILYRSDEFGYLFD